MRTEERITSLAYSIDPGISGTGLACWDWSPEMIDRRVNPLWVRNLYPRRGSRQWWDKADDLAVQIEGLIAAPGNPVLMMIEFPIHFESSTGIAAEMKGDIHKLAYLCGAIGRVGYSYGMTVKLYPVPVWKGQLPKPVVIHRIRQILPRIDVLKPVSHSWDTIGIGLYGKGLF